MKTYPLYLQRFSEEYVKVKAHSLGEKENEFLNSASWYFAIFTECVEGRYFDTAMEYLKLANVSLEQAASCTNHEAISKLKRFSLYVTKQYERFFEKKMLVLRSS